MLRPDAGVAREPSTGRTAFSNSMRLISFYPLIANRTGEIKTVASLLREWLASKSEREAANPCSILHPNTCLHKPSFHCGAGERYRRAIFPIRGRTAFVAKEFAKVADLRHGVGTVLITPLMVACAGQRLLLLRHDRVIYVHQQYAPLKYAGIAEAPTNNFAKTLALAESSKQQPTAKRACIQPSRTRIPNSPVLAQCTTSRGNRPVRLVAQSGGLDIDTPRL